MAFKIFLNQGKLCILELEVSWSSLVEGNEAVSAQVESCCVFDNIPKIYDVYERQRSILVWLLRQSICSSPSTKELHCGTISMMLKNGGFFWSTSSLTKKFGTITNEWIRTRVLWCANRLPCQLCNNHCPWVHFGIRFKYRKNIFFKLCISVVCGLVVNILATEPGDPSLIPVMYECCPLRTK